MDKDLEYIKKKFEDATVEIPSELDERVAQKLNAPKKIVPFVKTKAFKSAVALVACLAIFVGCLTTIKLNDNSQSYVSQAKEGKVQTFKSEKELENYIDKLVEDERFNLLGGLTMKDSASIDYALETQGSATADDDSLDVNASQSNYAQTYLQEKDVDEADQIKTYGKYIFKSNTFWGDGETESYIKIFEVNGKATKEISKISFKNDFNNTENCVERQISDFYVKDNRLIVQVQKINYDDISVNNTFTDCIVYDISNIEKPEKMYSFSQKGFLSSSRMIGDIVYLVSNYGFSYCKNIDDTLPVCYENDVCKKVSPSDIAYNDCKQKTFTVVSAVDTKNGKRVGNTKSVIGASEGVYCTTKNLYITGTSYEKSGVYTFVSKIPLDESLEFGATCKVKGYYDSQYSFSEKNDNLFVCTTVYDEKQEKEINYLYSYDKELKLISKTKGFGADESVRAVKYIGDYAYVITYEQTDPLFVIDISNPSDMKIKGSVKINGFSTMLVPVGDDKLIGIGNATEPVEDNEFEEDMERISGVKLVLFDISNPEKPTVLDEKIYDGYESVAQYNPRALIINNAEDYMAIPFENDDLHGAILFGVKGNKIVEKDSFSYDAYEEYSQTRITFINDYVYSLDDFGHIYSYNVK